VRAIRSDLHMDYTAVGQTVHLAARMEQLATPGSTRITAVTLQLIEGYVAVRALGRGAGRSEAALGRGGVAAVVGEPGVGKSRLFWELMRSHLTQGWLTLETSSVSWGKTTAYLPVVQLLKAYFQIQGSDDPLRVREKVSGKVLTLDQALATTNPALLA